MQSAAEKAKVAAAKAAQRASKAALRAEQAAQANALVVALGDEEVEPADQRAEEPAVKKRRGNEVVCGACGASSSSGTVQFLTNEIGIPVSPGDIICMANAKRLLPGSTFQEFCQRIKEDAHFADVASKGREAIAFELESRKGNPLPLFLPSSDIAETSSFGHTIYSKAGLLTDSELVRLVDKSAKDLQLKPFTSEWCSVKGEVSFYLISLQGLPADLMQTIRKVKLFHSVGTRSDWVWLNEATQLSKGQGADVSKHLALKYGERKRPAGLMNHSTADSTSLQTLEDLKQLAALLENTRQENLLTDAAGAGASAQAPEPVGPVKKSDTMLAALGDEEGPKKPVVRKKGKGKDPATAAAAQPSASGTAAPSKPLLTIGDGTKSDKSSKRAKEQQSLFEALDSEMQGVAALHVSCQGDRTSKNSGFKSLQFLTPEVFMTGTTDHNKGHCITGAEKIERSLQATQPDSHELQVLSRRIRLCTNLQTLEEITAKNLSTWAEFDITLKAVSEYCPKFPIALKVKVTFAYTIREMHRVSEVVTEDSSDKQDLVNQVNKFLDCFLVHLGGGEEWDGCQPTMSGLCLEAFETLTGHVKDMEDGNATEESGFIEAAAGTCVEVLKEVARITIEQFQDSSFRVMFANPVKYLQHLKVIAWQFLKNLQPCKSALEKLQAGDGDGFVAADSFDALTKELGRIENIMRFIASTLFTTSDMIEFTEDVGLTLKPSEDAVWLAGYTGEASFERGLSEIVKGSGAWTSITDELVKTAGSSTKLRPALERAVETLKSIRDGKLELTLLRLDDLNQIFPQLEAGMRRCDLEEAKTLMTSTLIAASDEILGDGAGKSSGVTSKFVSGLLKGFKNLSAMPGMTTKAQDLEKWMTVHVKEMAMNDLVRLAAPGYLDSLNDVQAVVGKLAKIPFPPDRPEIGLAARKLLNYGLSQLITEVNKDLAKITYQKLLKQTGLMSNLCKMAYPGDSDSDQEAARCVQWHTGLVKSGVSLKNSLDNLESLGASVEDIVRKDKGKVRLAAFLSSQKQFVDQLADFSKFKAESPTLQAVVEKAGRSAEDDILYDLILTIDSGKGFQEFCEADVVYDVLARHLVNHQSSLETHREKIPKGILKVTEENCWHKDLTPEDSIEVVLETGGNALLKLDLKGAIFKGILETFCKEIEAAKLLDSQIADSSMKRKEEANPDEASGFGCSLTSFRDKLQNAEVAYKLGARVYGEQTLVLSLRQFKADPSKIEKSRTLVRDTLVFLQKIETELEADIHPVLHQAATGLFG